MWVQCGKIWCPELIKFVNAYRVLRFQLLIIGFPAAATTATYTQETSEHL